MAKMNFDSLFGSEFNKVENSVVENKSERYVDDNLYIPKLEDAKKGVYTALIRLLPNAVDYSRSIIKKISYYLKDVNGENGVYVDSPESVGLPCPISTLRSKLWKGDIASRIAVAKANAGKETKYWSLVYIMKDPQHPELEGKVKVFRFGKKLYDKYVAASSTNMEEGEGIAANHIMYGKNLSLVIKLKDDYVNYDDSTFGARKPVEVNGEPVDSTPRGYELIEKLYENAPDLSKYEYHEWDETTLNKVLANIKTFDAILKNGEGTEDIENVVTQKNEKPKDPIDAAFGEASQPFVKKPVVKPAAKPAAKPAVEPKPTQNADLFDEIEDLDL